MESECLLFSADNQSLQSVFEAKQQSHEIAPLTPTTTLIDLDKN